MLGTGPERPYTGNAPRSTGSDQNRSRSQVSRPDADKNRGTRMDPSIRERLGLKPPSGPQSRERAERAMAARSLMYIFAVGAVIAAAALISPVAHSVDHLRIGISAGCSAV